MARDVYWKPTPESEPLWVRNVTEAKRLLKEQGGEAWIEHCDREGGCFETTEIELSGNNSHFKYNRHL